MTILCPTCGKPPATTATRYGVRASCCGLWSWGMKPLVTAATHEARKVAHAAFDPIWSGGRISRSGAYKALSKQLGLKPGDCHIALMSEETALRVPDAAAAILADLGK